jgi:Zn ribbon nucleic-acid-binding protein
MTPNIKPKESECGVQSLLANKQFSTRSCVRCAGLLVSEWYYGLHNTDEHNIETFRCVQCGHRVDPVILQNQIRPPVQCQFDRQARQRYSTRTAISSEIA